MRDRHIPRICRSCQAPLARQQDGCWRCGTDWATEHERAAPLRVIPGGALALPAGTRVPAVAAMLNGSLRAAVEARVAADRWSNEGGRA